MDSSYDNAYGFFGNEVDFNNGGGVSFTEHGESSSFNGGYLYNSQHATSFMDEPAESSHHSHYQQDFRVLDKDKAKRSEGKLGLKLTRTPSFVNLVEQLMNPNDGEWKDPLPENEDITSADMMKALNFPAQSLEIGSWKKVAKHENDIVVKCYFKKKKFVWEILQGCLKTKIEFEWKKIMNIRAKFAGNEQQKNEQQKQEQDYDILDIMLKEPPTFGREKNPTPRKHTNWASCDDFTHRQAASRVRRHTLKFAAGGLMKHYDRIIKVAGLVDLDSLPFPDKASPYFNKNYSENLISFENNPLDTVHCQIPSNVAAQYANMDGTISPSSVMNFPGQFGEVRNCHMQVYEPNQNFTMRYAGHPPPFFHNNQFQAVPSIAENRNTLHQPQPARFQTPVEDGWMASAQCQPALNTQVYPPQHDMRLPQEIAPRTNFGYSAEGLPYMNHHQSWPEANPSQDYSSFRTNPSQDYPFRPDHFS